MQYELEIDTVINGKELRRLVNPRQHLADFLREELELTGTHLGCEQGVCGACSVLVDGKITRGCLMFAVQADGKRIDTIEGMSDSGALAELQSAFAERNAAQCGFCSSGMLLTAHELLGTGHAFARADIREFISGNLCRCTGYESIVDAIETVLRKRNQISEYLPPGGTEPLRESEHPDGLIGKRIPRRESMRFLRGRGRYVGDIKLPRMLHLAFARSPRAHARIVSIDVELAKKFPGVAFVFTGRDLLAHGKGFEADGLAHNRPGHKVPPQELIAIDVAHFQGQPVAAVVAESRAEAEDAVELLDIKWEELPVLLDGETSLQSSPIHKSLCDNLAYEHNIKAGDPDSAFATADHVVEKTFNFHRQTGLSLEPRGLIADFDPGGETLTVYHSHQSPYQMQGVFSRQLGIPEHKVRVIAPDVGGGFGIKINVYAEEVAVAVISMMIGQPVKYCADRLESFVSDNHVRDHIIKARMSFKADGKITAISVDDVSAIGAYGMPMRFNITESMMLVTNTGAAYDFPNYRARTRNAFVNKPLIGMFRGVGIPLSTIVSEVLTDMAAAKLAVDPVAFKRLNYRKTDAMPCVTAAGSKLDNISFDACLDRLVQVMRYDRLRQEQAELRKAGIHRGIGIATFVEPTAYGPVFYGPTGASISVQDGCTIRLEPTGLLRCVTSITDQGQGTIHSLAQIIADTLGVDIDDVAMIGGDSAISTYGGGAWASRGIAIGGEAALKAARDLAQNILLVAAAITQTKPENLRIVRGQICNKHSDAPVITVAEVAKIGYFRQDTLPPDLDVQFTVTRSHVANSASYYMGHGAHAAYLDVDSGTGLIKLLNYWAITDCGRVINPLIVDDQVRGAIVQGIGSVLYEECIYDEHGSLINGNFVDYLAPMAYEMPDIYVEQIETPERSTELGAKGVGELGLTGAMGALWVAANDALRGLGATIADQPFTPERVLKAIASTRTGVI
jgi:CO/xanthine dehydrogenase Mo-binding subunit/aerobic-type carbon monoxide dehydrogenase small subunit (CoxS/CutS family)